MNSISIFNLKNPKVRNNNNYDKEIIEYKEKLQNLIKDHKINIDIPDQKTGNSFLMKIAKTDNLNLFKHVLTTYNPDINKIYEHRSTSGFTLHDKQANKGIMPIFSSLLECICYYHSWNILEYLLTYTNLEYQDMFSPNDYSQYGRFKYFNVLYFALRFEAPVVIIYKIFTKFGKEDLFKWNEYDDTYCEFLLYLTTSKEILKILVYNLCKITKDQRELIHKKLQEFDKISPINDSADIIKCAQNLKLVAGCNCSAGSDEEE